MDNNYQAPPAPQGPPPPPVPQAPPPPPVYTNTYRPYTPLPKKPFAMARGDLAFTLVSVLLGFFFIRFILWGGLGFGAGLFALMFACAAVARHRLNGVKRPVGLWPYFALLLVSAVYFITYENTALKVLILLLNIAAGAWFIAAAPGNRTEDRLGRYAVLDGWDALVLTPFSHMGTWFGALGAGLKARKKDKNILFLLLGVAIALPVLLVIGTVLSSADAAFEVFWTRFIRNFWNEAVVILVQLSLSVPVTLYLYGAFYGNRHHRHRAKRDKESADRLLEKNHVIPLALLMGVVFPVLLLYLVFFGTQITYFLSSFQSYVPDGFSASEFARRGFYELCFVAGFNLALWAVVRAFGQKGKRPALLRGVGTALSAVSLGMLAIALSRMVLNIQTYGLTLNRVYTTAFMVLIGGWFVFTAIRIFAPRFPLERAAVVLTVVMLLGLAFSNPNRWVARYNVSAYQAGRLEQLDVPALGRLGSAAAPVLIEVMSDESMSRRQREEAALGLDAIGGRRNWSRANWDWRDDSLSSLRAERLIRGHREEVQRRVSDWTRRRG